MPPRTLAIGDVHGCSAALAGLIELLDPQPDNRLVMLGDYVDRGPDSKGVLDQLIELQSRCRLVPLLGNHDVMLLGARFSEALMRDWLQFGGLETLDSYGSGGLDDVPASHYAFLHSCQSFLELERHFFVHACYDPDRPLDMQDEHALLWLSLRDHLPGPHCSGKTAIVGHTSQKSGEVLDLGYLKCIDTHCYGGGWLTALDVETGQLWQVDQQGRRRP